MNQGEFIKEGFLLFDKINHYLAINYYSLLEIELSPKQFMVLHLIHEIEPAKIQDISQQLNLSMSSVSQLVNKLEQENYVSRSINPQNRREILVTVGEKGKEFFKKYEEMDNLVIEKYYSKLSIRETKQFRDFAKKLYSLIVEESDHV
ncbi:MarR family winged helix-turn-helix transcriptional regulator [Siminovitchia sp. 179-K 8D1 HS]|uniref:MarR family winged helix-turn-helix transcriptional regulator n=1 Tax=Siminovitchia sp. 179-K 8D1 HS TaxID=3142385 RepID=UPI0039A0F540